MRPTQPPPLQAAFRFLLGRSAQREVELPTPDWEILGDVGVAAGDDRGWQGGRCNALTVHTSKCLE